jgi:hypothetical protein
MWGCLPLHSDYTSYRRNPGLLLPLPITQGLINAVVFSRDVGRCVAGNVVRFVVDVLVATIFSCLVANWCRGCRTFVFEVVKLRRIGEVS